MPILAENKRAKFDYQILETYEAGMELSGFEVKAARAGRINLSGTYVIIRGNEAWLINADIAPYQVGNAPEGYDPRRTRRLLLGKSEIKSLIGKIHEKGLTLLPLKVYTAGRRQWIKIELGLGKSRKKADKREYEREKEVKKEIRERQF